MLFSNAQRKKDKTEGISKSATKSVIENSTPFKGFFNFYYNESKDRIYLEVDQLETPFLYVNALSAGIGSNDIGLDRGQLGNSRLVFFQKAGNKLMLVQPNMNYRANTENILEKRSVEQAFAKSILFGFPIVEEKEGTYIIDLTPFLMRDAHGVSKRLSQRKQGTYKIDASRSAISLDRTKAFPKNIEMDVMLTFKGQAMGSFVRSVTPSPDAVTVHQHHSLIALPDDNFKQRRFDPRTGGMPFTFNDYATPVNENTLQRFIVRHRLEKKDPNVAVSEAVEPIIYYLDNGTPEPVRSALLEGGRWWNQAFESIGYKDAFQVKMLPDDADPLDIRYNVIQWVHRSTRGWSYGASVRDPRTGEIIKGQVSLGSLRIRQDFMIALGLTEAPYETDSNKENQALEMALARIRQLSAHEIGHTLGFAHNFAASPNNRCSVMDYPHPTLDLVDGKISYKNAYAVGIGDWDKVSVAYSYSDFPVGVEEDKALNAIIEKSIADGHRFISDSDARPTGGAHPTAHLWDNGASATEELNKIMQIRKMALNGLSLDHIKEQEAYSVLEDRMVPIYLLHRYQVEAVSKLIGGMNYDYGVKGKVAYAAKAVSLDEQISAFIALLNCLQPEELALPEHLRELLLPRAYGYSRGRENFLSQTGVTFDFLGITNTLSDAILSLLLHPQRAARLVQQSGMDKKQLSLEGVVEKLIQSTFKEKYSDSHHQQINEVVKSNVLEHLMVLGQSDTYSEVGAVIFNQLNTLDGWLATQNNTDYAEYYRERIQGYFDAPERFKRLSSPRIPDGSPIGNYSCDF